MGLLTEKQARQMLGDKYPEPVYEKTRNTTTNTVADLEPNTRHESLGTKKAQGDDPRCCIHVHSRRHRLADPDGISAKAAIDGLVLSGVLPDDTTDEIQEVTYSQEKIRKKEQEETIITLTWGK